MSALLLKCLKIDHSHVSANSAPHERANDSEWDQYLFSCDKTKLKIRGGGGQFVDKMLFDIPIYFYYSIFILKKYYITI